MRMSSFRSVALLPSFLTIGLLACEGDEQVFGAPNAERQDAARTEERLQDAGQNPDAAAQCATTVGSAAVHEGLVSSNTGSKVWVIRARQSDTFLTLTVREVAGGRAGASSGGFGDEQRKPGSAAVSLLVQTDCSAHEDHFHCGPSYYPTSGAWKIDALENDVSGTFDVRLDAVLQQMSLKSGMATPTPNGNTLCVQGLRLQGKLVAP